MTAITDRLSAALAARYVIDRELGTGGMAAVYLARDLRHDREVAIKVLHPELAATLGAERFLSEIKTTARLHHPHILALLDSGEADGLLYYVMPYVRGESLRDKLSRERQLGLDEALRIAREVADALGYAHAAGIVHRDIKPENILLQGGHAMVADFGIALAVQQAGGERMTQTGLSLGTPHYMSPEQASGERAIDARSDIYSLGAVAYEMLAGAPPFTAPTMQAVVARVLAETPRSLIEQRHTIPAHVEDAVLAALEKLPADRPASAGEFAARLGGDVAMPVTQRTARRAAGPAGRRRVDLVVIAGGSLAVAGAFLLGHSVGTRGGMGSWEFGQATQATWDPGLELTPAISPDGKQLAYVVTDGIRSKIQLRPVSGGRAVPLTDDTVAVETHPEWSRDGTRILYLRGGQVFSAPSGGGAPRQEVPTRGGEVESATWSPDGQRIAYVIDDTVFVRGADGVTREVGTFVQPGLCTWGPRELIACMADNRWYLKPGLAFGNAAPSFIVVLDAATGRVHGISDSLSSNVAPRWSSDGGSVIYASNRLGPADLYAVPIGHDGAPTGETRRLTVGLRVNSFTLSADGSRIAYAVSDVSSNVWSQPFHGGAADPRDRPTQVTFGQQVIEGFTVSRDGRWLYYDSDLAGNSDLYRMSLAAGHPERLTATRAPEFAADPSPDGRVVAFHSWRTSSREVYVMPLDGGPVEQVTRTPYQEQNAVWSPDGRTLAFSNQSQPSGTYLATRGADGAWQVRKRLDEGHWVTWSPDGRFLAYTDVLLGGGLLVVPIDSGAPRRLYDDSAPGAPKAEVSAWSSDGRTLYFKSHASNGGIFLWSVPFAGGTPRRLLSLGSGQLRSDRYGFRINRDRLYYVLFDRQSNIWVMDVRR